MDILLSPVEQRILGCLMEKEIATPDYYPMTLNALVAACNQKSNRHPVMTLDDQTVTKTLDELRYDKKLLLCIDSAGSRVLKYKHDMQSTFGIDTADRAILCVLFLRGPQTAGELRTRTRRLHAFPDIAAVEDVLRELAGREDHPFVVMLPRESGRKECRWTHCFGGKTETAPIQPRPAAERIRQDSPREDPRIADLEQKTTALRNDLDQLTQAFETFKKQFD